MNSFYTPVALPIWKDGAQQEPVLCAGYIQLRSGYDGFRNNVEIQPIANDARFICALECNAIGEPYWITVRHLDRLRNAGYALYEAQRMAEIEAKAKPVQDEVQDSTKAPA